MVGALQLARALGDEKQARALLKSARTALLDQYDTPSLAREHTAPFFRVRPKI
jgi:hypothetical protein